MTPHGIEELVAGDQALWPGEQLQDHRESARLEGHLGAAAGKAPVGRVDVEVTAAITQRLQVDPPVGPAGGLLMQL